MSGEREAEVRRLFGAAEAAAAAGRLDEALPRFQRLVPLLIDLGDLLGAGRIHLRVGRILEEASRFDEARDQYGRARGLARRLGDRELAAAALHRLGHLEQLRDPPLARSLFQESLELEREGSEAHALALAMIGQIDFLGGAQPEGMYGMLCGLRAMPRSAGENRGHLAEHIAYFGTRMHRGEYVRLVEECISEEQLRWQLLDARRPGSEAGDESDDDEGE